MGISRRALLVGAGVGATGLALGLYSPRQKPRQGLTDPDTIRFSVDRITYDDWSDFYRESWTWDRVAKGSHNRANCFSACSWNLFVKEGIVWHEEQNAVYEQTHEGATGGAGEKPCRSRSSSRLAASSQK